MSSQGTNAVRENLQKVSEKLEAARKMQDSWMDRGLDFVDLYVEDAGGDWWKQWAKEEKASEFETKRSVDIETVKQAIGFPEFKKKTLLEIALTRPAQTQDCPDRANDLPAGQNVKYKRLILLGRAIFNAAVTDYLYREYPPFDRAGLSILKSNLSDKKKLSEFALALKLDELIWRGHSAEETDKSEYNKLLGETFEAVFGAVYLECDRDFVRAGDWLIQRFIEKAVGENLDLQQPQIPPESEGKRLAILGADILEAIAIDYLYNRFPEVKASQLTKWKNKLAIEKIFPKNFKAKLGSQYLELASNFSRTRDWLVDNFIKTAVDELVEETGN
jgi:dsRNA-specific ribonuclease